jgi:RecA-family ATPase
MILLAGSPGAGKSYLSYSLALSGAVGRDFLGQPTVSFKTCYFDEENATEDSLAYLRWAWSGLGHPDAHLAAENFALFGMALARQQSTAHVYEFMRQQCAQHQPNLIVIDTATPACRIQDENDNAEASIAIRQLRKIRSVAAPNCTLLILKHMRVDRADGHRDIRGAKAWAGECDGILFHERKGGRPLKLLGHSFSATKLIPNKVRAIGLSEPLTITPIEAHGGILLTASWPNENISDQE